MLLPVLLTFLGLSAANAWVSAELPPSPTASSNCKPPPRSNDTYVHLPRSDTWWTLGQPNDILWNWSDAPGPVDIVLRNHNATLLQCPLELQLEIPGNWFGVTVNQTSLPHVAPGVGYQIAIEDSVDKSVFATSDEFEIKAEGSGPYHQPPPCYPTSSPYYNSGNRRSPGRRVGLGAAALILVAMS